MVKDPFDYVMVGKVIVNDLGYTRTVINRKLTSDYSKDGREVEVLVTRLGSSLCKGDINTLTREMFHKSNWRQQKDPAR